jgi:hypothetical protein
MQDHESGLACPRCGTTFPRVSWSPAAKRLDCRPHTERFVHHVQRDHDLDEHEAVTLIRAGAILFEAETTAGTPIRTSTVAGNYVPWGDSPRAARLERHAASGG